MSKEQGSQGQKDGKTEEKRSQGQKRKKQGQQSGKTRFVSIFFYTDIYYCKFGLTLLL